jgi:predicted enzyme related to lactoylglutathione lyase
MKDGWKLENHPMGEGDYLVVENESEQVAGIMLKPQKAAAVPPRDIPTIGRFCTFTDPQGAYISAITYITA